MNHTIRVKKHVIRDILASVVGGAFVGAIIQKSWIAAGLAVIVGFALFIEEKVDIQEEDEQ